MPGRGHVPGWAERVQRSLKANTTRTAGGLGSNASPSMTRDRVGASRRGTSTAAPTAARSSKVDDWDVTGTGTATFTTTYLPLPDSWNLMLNGVRVHRDEWSLSGRTVTIVSPTDLFKGVTTQGSPWNLEFQYDYLSAVPVAPPDSPGPYVEAVLASSPRFYYRLNEASGSTANDSSGNARHGTIFGAVTYSRPGLLTTDANTAMFFDAVEYVTLGSNAGDRTTGATVEFWSNTGGAGTTNLFNWLDRFQVGKVGAQCRVAVWSGGTPTVVASTDSGYFITGPHYYVITVDSAGAIFYRDGAVYATVPVAITWPAAGGDIRFGGETGSMNDGDEFAFYNTVLSSADVAAHWAAR